MSHRIPLDVAEVIVDYVADSEDAIALKNLSLTSRDFRTLAQARIFSTVLLDGNANRARLIFFEDLLNGNRGPIIAGHIRNLYLLYCDDWFAEEEEGDNVDLHEHGETDISENEVAEREQDSSESECTSMAEDSTSELAFGTMIEFIAQHATRLRSIHIGPFSEIHLDWHDISDNVRHVIAHLLISAEEIALEGITNIPYILFQNLENVKSLDVAHVVPSFSHFAPPPSIPSLTSLAIHPGINRFSITPDDMWDMTSFLYNVTFGAFLNLSNLTTLSLYLLDDPNKNRMIKEVLALCAASLRTLKLYIWERCNYDGNVIDFSRLLTLQSLTLVTDFTSIRSSIHCLSDAINTISTQPMKLKDLRLAVDRENGFRDWSVGLTDVHMTPDPWANLFKTNISRILHGSANVHVAFEFPPLRFPFPTSTLTRSRAIANILGIEDMNDAVKGRLTFGIQDVSIKTAFTLRTEAEIHSASKSAPKPSFSGYPYYESDGENMETEALVEGNDQL